MLAWGNSTKENLFFRANGPLRTCRQPDFLLFPLEADNYYHTGGWCLFNIWPWVHVFSFPSLHIGGIVWCFIFWVVPLTREVTRNGIDAAGSDFLLLPPNDIPFTGILCNEEEIIYTLELHRIYPTGRMGPGPGDPIFVSIKYFFFNSPKQFCIFFPWYKKEIRDT